MKLYHITTLERAGIIKSRGFRDAEGSYSLMYEDQTPYHIRGVFFSDSPLECNDGLPADVSEVFVLEIQDDEIELYELSKKVKGTGNGVSLLDLSIGTSPKRNLSNLTVCCGALTKVAPTKKNHLTTATMASSYPISLSRFCY